MEAAAQDIVNNRAMPLLNELFDGWVLVGYHTTTDGKRERVVMFNDSRSTDKPDAMMVDAMAVPVSFGVQWAGKGAQR